MQSVILVISSSRETIQSTRMTQVYRKQQKKTHNGDIKSRKYFAENLSLHYKEHMKKKGTVTQLIINFKKSHKYYPLTRCEVADNFPVKPHINCSIDWTSINASPQYFCNEGKIAIFLFQETKVWPESVLSQVTSKAFIRNGGYTQHFNSSDPRLVWMQTIHIPGRSGMIRRDNSSLLLKGKKSQISAFSFWQCNNSFNRKLILKEKTILHLPTEYILQLWIFFAIMHIKKS